MVVSATDIFRKLIKDPEYIGREDEARSEAEYRARQHYNNVQALAMASDETTTIKTSAINSLSSFLGKVLDIIKSYYNDTNFQIDSLNKQIGTLADLPNLPQKTQDFIQSLEESGVAYQQIKKITDYAVHKHAENPDIEFGQDMAYTLATNESFAKSLGMTPLMHKAVIATLKSKKFDLPNSLTKPTTQPSLLGSNFYGDNSEAELEMPASPTNVNAALKKMGRKETISSGSTGKIKFEGGNSDQWHKFWPGKAQARLYHSMITGNDPDTSQTEESEVVGGGQLQQYTVAQVLHGLHHTINHDGGRYDITPEQQEAKIGKLEQEVIAKFKQKDMEEKELLNNPNLENDSLPADAEEAKQVYANPDAKDANIPHVIYGSYGDEKTGIKDHPAIQMGIAHGLCNASGVLTPLAESMMLHAKGENGWGHKQHVFHHKGENVHVISWDGIQDIIDTYKLMPGKDQETQAYLNDQIIKDAVGDYFKDVDNLDEAVNKQSQTWEDKETQPNPEFTNLEGKSDATKQLNTWDDLGNKSTHLNVGLASGVSDDMISAMYTALAFSFDDYSKKSSNATDPPNAAIDHVLEQMDSINHIDVLDKLGNEMNTPNVKDHPYVKHLKKLDDALQQVADAEMGGYDSDGNVVTDNADFAEAMDNLTATAEFVSGMGQTDSQFQYPDGMLNSDFFHSKLNAVAPNVADHITDNSQHFLGQLQQIADTHPQLSDALMSYSPIDHAPPDAKMAYDKHKFQQQKAPSPETEHSFEDGYGLDSTPGTHLVIHQNEDGTYSNTHVTQSSPEKAVELASATQGDKKYIGTITDSSTGMGYESQKLAEKMIEEKGHGQIHSPQPDQPVATDDSVVSDDTPTKTVRVQFPEGGDNAGILTEVEVADHLSDADAFSAAVEILRSNDFDTSGLTAENASYYNAEDSSLQPLEVPSSPDSEEDTVTQDPLPESQTAQTDEQANAEKPSEVTTTPAAPSEEEVQAKHNAKKDKVMASIFGDDLSGEDAQVYSEWLDENPKEVAGAYKQHVIGGVLNKIKEQQTNAKKQEAEQVKQEAAQAKQEATEAAAQQKEEDKQAVEEANTLPHEPGDLASMGEEEGVSVATATSHARDLMAHKMKHEDKMSAKTKEALKNELQETVKYGADLDKLEEEMNQYGDKFGSPEHIEETHKQDIKSHTHEQNYKDLTSSTLPEHVKAREESFYSGQYNKFSTFNEDGKIRTTTHLGYDKETGKGDLLGGNKKGEYQHFYDRSRARQTEGQGHGNGQSYSYSHKKDGSGEVDVVAASFGNGEKKHGQMKTHQKVHATTGKAVGTHHMLDNLTPKQESLLKDYRESELTGNKKGMLEASAQLEESGVDIKSLTGEHPEDETPKTGPPNPEVAAKKMAEGYVWHEETRHWIKRDTLNELQGGLGAHDASLVSGTHNDFAHDEAGVPSQKNFLLHGSGNLMGVGGYDTKTGKPKGVPGKGGFATHNDVVETSLANELHNKGHLEGHTGAKKLSNFSHPNASSGGGMNMGKRLGFNGAHKSHPNPKIGTASTIASGLKGFASDAVAAFKEGQAQGSVKKSEDSSSALTEFLKAHSNHPLHHKKKVRELLEKESIIH